MTAELLSSRHGRVAAALVSLLAVATLVAIALLWPTGETDAKLAPAIDLESESAEVVAVTATRCPAPELTGCGRVRIELTTGPDAGREFDIDQGGGSPKTFDPGDEVRVTKNVEIDGIKPAEPYSLNDFDRSTPILLLTVGFVVFVAVLGRRRGVMALVGLAASLAIVIGFIVPAMLDGRPPLAVALAGGLAVMLVTLALAHGIGAKSVAAALGTALSLSLTVVLALIFTKAAHLSGFSSDEATLLQAADTTISLQGLVVAGMVIGALGVLDDVTVSQASAVMALRRANPAQTVRDLYRGALEIGRDHVAATVNTLVLAYAGAALPILLVFSVGAMPFADAVNGEAVAAQIVATLVGSVGLIAAVPITTSIAALLAVHLPADRIRESHAH